MIIRIPEKKLNERQGLTGAGTNEPSTGTDHRGVLYSCTAEQHSALYYQKQLYRNKKSHVTRTKRGQRVTVKGGNSDCHLLESPD